MTSVLWISFGIACLGILYDALTTRAALALGHKEGNPIRRFLIQKLGRNAGTFGVAVVACGFIAYMNTRGGYLPTQIAANLMVGLVFGLVGSWNYKKAFKAALLLFILPSMLEAQTTYVRAIHVQELPKCKKNIDGVGYAVDNATSDSVLGTGTGTAVTMAQCDGDTQVWETLVPGVAVGADLEGDPDVDIDTDDAGSDVIVTPFDDFLLTSGDAVTVSAGGAILLDSTTGTGIILDTDAASSDVTISPVDDLILAAGDFATIDAAGGGITINAGTLVNINAVTDITLSAAGDVLVDSMAGTGITLDTDAAGSDVTVTPVDDFLVTAGDAAHIITLGTLTLESTTGAGGIVLDTDEATADVNLTPADDFLVSTGDDMTFAIAGDITLSSVAGAIVIDSGAGTGITLDTDAAGSDITMTPVDDLALTVGDDTTITGDVVLFSNTTTTFDPGGSTDELTVVTGSVRAGVALGIPAAASLPTCDSTIAPAGTTALYWDTTGPDLCACPEGVDWVTIDGSGTCA